MPLALESLKGLGVKRIAQLNSLGIYSVEDLIMTMPRRYRDMSHVVNIASVLDGEEVAVVARVAVAPSVVRTGRGLAIVRAMIEDVSGRAECVWFNQVYLANQLKVGQNYLFFGKAALQRGKLKINNPYCELLGENLVFDKILPIYALKKATVSQKLFRTLVKEALQLTNGQLKEVFTERFRQAFNLAERNFALEQIHFPQNQDALQVARRRIAFEELITFQMSIQLYKEQNQRIKPGKMRVDEKVINDFMSRLPFPLTNAQMRTLKEVQGDLTSLNAMNRLVQGDVGSGKTVIALFAMYCGVVNGYQTVLMAPTEILAQQHYQEITARFPEVNSVLLTGSMTKAQREQVLGKIASGEAQMIIGTHAVFSENVVFKKLGVIITDEQHRFGVRQRAAIAAKGDVPDCLVMSATPIPRTLALILYGDLDISIIDELPPGRKRVKTFIIAESRRKDMYGYIARSVREGRQCYMICPLVEETEAIEAVSAEEMYKRILTEFKGFNVALMHGKLSGKEKTRIMEAFASGEVQILVSTTVVEVGVNVPNATMMVIENANRFGLAQLHQLRGRVGRGKHESFCFLMPGEGENVSLERLEIMTKTQNGFEIAEYDLNLRGPGDFLGTRQHGLPDIDMAGFIKDMSLVKETKEALQVLDRPEYAQDKAVLKAYAKEKNAKKHENIAMN